MMGSLFQISFTNVNASTIRLGSFSYKHERSMPNSKRTCLVCCQSGSHPDPDLSPNQKTPVGGLMVKGPVHYNESSDSSLARARDGIGIIKYLRGKVFFITGATGFLAKVLIEKLLRTVPNVGKIYVMIRAKTTEDASGRLKNEIIRSEIFKCIEEIHGKSYEEFMLSKLVPVPGNICEPNLGLDQYTASLIAQDVDIILNSAANTNFSERYNIALDINTMGPSRVVAFANTCKKLNLLLQISTAYVNGQRQGIFMERPLSIGDPIISPLDVEAELNLARRRTAEENNNNAQKIKELGLQRAKKYGWQDTYAFTKAMGEMLLGTIRRDIPVVILRPSIVESTYKDPFPGWIEGNRMIDPIVIRYGKRQLPGFLADPNGTLDVVPVDMVVNATLAAIAKHGMTSREPGISVYQVASSVVNPVTIKDLAEFFYQHFTRCPCLDVEGRPIHVQPFKIFESVDDFSSYIWRQTKCKIDSSVDPLLNGKHSRKVESICRKAVAQIKNLASIYEPYTFYGGRFDISNTNLLLESMSTEEKEAFYFDVRSIDWEDYIHNVHIPGLRRYVMKEKSRATA